MLSLKLLLIQTFCAESWLKRWVRQIFINLKKVEKRSSITKDDFPLILEWVSLMVWELSQINSSNGHQKKLKNFSWHPSLACCSQVLPSFFYSLLLFLCLFLCLCLSVSLYFSSIFYLCVSMSFYLSICLSISVHICVSLSTYVYLCLPLSMSGYLCLSPSISVISVSLCLYLYFSVFAYLCLCLSLSLIVSPSLSRAVLLFLSVKLICVEQHGHVLLLVLLKYHMCFSKKLFKYLQYFDFIVVAFGFIMEIRFN